MPRSDPEPHHRRPERRLRLGTRASPLALAQAGAVRAALAAALGRDEATITLCPLVASGDRLVDRPLAEVGGKAVWTKELDAALLAGEIDCAVHSAKDIETLRPPAIAIAATLPRGPVHDVLIGAARLEDLAPGARLGTSAPRRAAQARHARPDWEIVALRGNVATRLAKLAAGETDAIILAAAGLARLGLTHGTPLAPEAWLPALGQGVIAIEARRDDAAMLAWLGKIDDAPTHAALTAERALLAALGGSCHSPVAGWASDTPGNMVLRAALFSADGAERILGEIRLAEDAAAPARLAADLLARAPAAIRRHFLPPADVSAR